mgnify:CR=1 FL=1
MKKSKEKKWKDFEFELFGTKWKVIFIDKVKETEEMYLMGNCSYVSGTIWVATQDNEGNPLKEEAVRINMLHELTHSILDTGGYNNSSNDEPLVEWIARCLNSLLKQNVFDYAK